MFERLTDRARYVIVVQAKAEARILNHGYIGTEHLLLALISEGEGIAARTLASFDISTEDVRAQVAAVVGKGPFEPTGSIAFTRPAKDVLQSALIESTRMGHRHIGTEHLLLGLLRAPEDNVVQVLQRLQIDPADIKDRLKQISLQIGSEPMEDPKLLATPLGETGYTVGDVLERLGDILTADRSPIEVAYANSNQRTLAEAQRHVGSIFSHIGVPTVRYQLCSTYAYELEELALLLGQTRAPRSPQLRAAITAFVDLCVAKLERAKTDTGGDQPGA